MAKFGWVSLVTIVFLFTKDTTGFPKQAAFVTKLEGEPLETGNLIAGVRYTQEKKNPMKFPT